LTASDLIRGDLDEFCERASRAPPRGWDASKLHALERMHVDERADKSPGFAWITNLCRGINFRESAHENVINAVMDEETPQRRTALPCSPHGGKSDRADGKIKIRRGSNDCGIVATELQDCSSEACSETRADGASHSGRSSRRNDSDAVVVDQRLPDIASTYEKAE
jgi:hypothetical protein